MTKILVLASNPQDTARVRLDEEIHQIEDALARAHNREDFDLRSILAVRIDDLQESIIQENPRIVHFCGHGVGRGGLVLQTESGEPQLVNTQALGGLFKLFANQVECVMLNACYSQVQAEVINQHINYVIGTKKQIQDKAAISFTRGFYTALFNGESLERAYKLGCNRIQLDIYGSSNCERKLLPVYSEEQGKWIELPQNEVLVLLKKEPLNQIEPEPVEPEPVHSSCNHRNQIGKLDTHNKLNGMLVSLSPQLFRDNDSQEIIIEGTIAFSKAEVVVPIKREHPILANLLSKLTRLLGGQSKIESVMGKNRMLQIKLPGKQQNQTSSIFVAFGIKTGKLVGEISKGEMPLGQCQLIEEQEERDWRGTPTGNSQEPIWDFKIIDSSTNRYLYGISQNHPWGTLRLLNSNSCDIEFLFKIQQCNRYYIEFLEIIPKFNKKQAETMKAKILEYLKTEEQFEEFLSRVDIKIGA
ncbi:MAG: CHAT domain-containing protein [Xenococcaceae cyanobacterium]